MKPQQASVDAPLYPNCKVEWTYKHWLNSKAYTLITKKGIIKRQVRERNGLQRPSGYYLVQFDGNKTASRIHESRLKNMSVKLISHD